MWRSEFGLVKIAWSDKSRKALIARSVRAFFHRILKLGFWRQLNTELSGTAIAVSA
jgi:hypothetical protein